MKTSSSETFSSWLEKKHKEKQNKCKQRDFVAVHSSTLKQHVCAHLKTHTLTHGKEKTHFCSEFKRSFDLAEQRKGTRLCPLPEVIWSSCTTEKSHAHPQWSEVPHLLRM